MLKLEGLCSRIPLQLPDGKEDVVSKLNNKITGILSSIVTRSVNNIPLFLAQYFQLLKST